MRATQEQGFPYLIIGVSLGRWFAGIEEYFGGDKTQRRGGPREPTGRQE